MWYGVGIDLGTSFTCAAVSGTGGTRMVPLGREVTVPSVAYSAPDGGLLTGTAAQAAEEDPARVTRNFKRRLGDPTPLMLGGSAYSAAALMAAQLRDVLADTTSFAGSPPASVVLTCPAIWGPYRREHFTEVLRLAGVADYRLVTEPEAAATHYSSERRLGDGEVVAVYDLGGGTFDTTILRMRGGGMEILGTPEGIEHMGGVDFDESLLAHVDDRLDGAINELDPSDPGAARALAEIRTMCVRAKENLSLEPDVTLTVPLPSGPREVTITRLEFNEMIKPSIQLTTDALHRTIVSAGLRTEDLSAVLLAGGSSRVPLVSQLVSEEFGKPVRVTLHPKFTVALGAAAIAANSRPTTSNGSVSAGPARPPTPPSGLPAQESPAPAPARRRWPVPVVAAAIVVVLAIVTTLLIVSDGEQARQAGDTPSTGTTADPSGVGDSSPSSETGPPSTGQGQPDGNPPSLRLYDDAAVEPFLGFIGDPGSWAGSEISAAGATQGSISATPDGTQGLRVTWAGGAPGQIYLRSPNDPKDLSSYVDAGGALVFDVVVHQAPTARTTLQVHCGHACKALLPAKRMFTLLAGKPTTVKVPLSCFAEHGLNPKQVDTPFLVYSEGEFDATFANIRWEKAPPKPPTMRCPKPN